MSHLSTQLREGTRHSHTATENTAFMQCLLRGVVERKPLRKLFADLFFIYTALEYALQAHADHPIVGQIYFPELNRAESLMQDLEFYYGETWPERIQLSRAGQVYRGRIQILSEQDPVLLIAHAYTRYMGDLSGGQGLKHIIRTALSLPLDQGTQFYEFPQIPTPEARRSFKAHYRQVLDDLPLDEATIERIVAEANHAFTLNRELMHDLEADVIAAIGEQRFNSLTRSTHPGSTEPNVSRAAQPEFAIGV